MKKFQNARTVLCLVLAVLIFGGTAGYAFYRNSENTEGKAPENILKIAEQTLAENRDEISALIKENGDAGIAPSELSLGKHFNISYPVAVSKAKRSKSENFNDYLKDSGEWLFLVMDQDKPVSTLAVDEKGRCVSGDEIMYMCARYMKEQGELETNTVVTTVMSNFGLYQALDKAGIRYEKTAVGDKYVWENMRANGHVIGGEQSGHIIFSKFANTGDGLITAIKLMEVMIEAKSPLSKLTEPVTIYPQVLKNVAVIDKDAALTDGAVRRAVQAAERSLGERGRVLLRKSGTEPLLRVMVEAPTHKECEQNVDAIIEAMGVSGHLAEVI